MHFKKEPFSARVKDSLYLLKHSFSVIAKDKDILQPMYRMLGFSVFFVFCLAISIGLFFTPLLPLGFLGLLFVLFVLFPYSSFFYTRMKACQSWIVYQTITGGDIDYAQAKAHVITQNKNIRYLAFIDLVVRVTLSQRKSNRKGIIGVFVAIFLAALLEVWDLLQHYMIPAVVIEQKPLKELLVKLKALQNNVPATLVGVFGIDFVGNVLGSLIFTPIFLFSLLLGLFLTFTFNAPYIVWTVVGGILVSFMINVLLNPLVQSVKTIYFTIFYTALVQPKKIDKKMRAELTRYLKFGK